MSRRTILLLQDFMHVCLTGLQRDQSSVTVSGDGDNSLSMRSVKVAAYGSMNHASGAGGGWHRTATALFGGVE